MLEANEHRVPEDLDSTDTPSEVRSESAKEPQREPGQQSEPARVDRRVDAPAEQNRRADAAPAEPLLEADMAPRESAKEPQREPGERSELARAERRVDAPAEQPANPRSASEVRSEPQTIWILGGTGYVGRAVTQEVVRRYPNSRVIALGHHRVDPWVMEHTHFIMSDLGSFDFAWLERFPPDVIFHCGRMAGGNWLTRKRAGRNGARANQRWIQALSALPVKPVVVYCSGTLMYGNQADPVTERVPHQPVAYARFYQKAEAPWYGAEALDVRWGLPAWITGPDSWFAAFFLAPALHTGRVPYYGSGAQWMSLVHLRDCARQLVGVYADGSPGCSYNIYGGEAISQRDFAQKIADRLKLPIAAISLEDTRKKYGITVLEALTSNIPVDTEHREWKKSQKLEFRSTDAILDDAIHAYLQSPLNK